MKRRLRRISLFVALALACAVAPWCWRLIRGPYVGYKPIRFSHAAWVKAQPETRGYMVDDLLKTRLLEGKTFQEVGQLLGSPNSQISVDELYEKWAAVRDATVLRKDFGSPGPGWPYEYMYNVGYMGFDREFPMVLSYDLYVKFRDGHVSKAYVHD